MTDQVRRRLRQGRLRLRLLPLERPQVLRPRVRLCRRLDAEGDGRDAVPHHRRLRQRKPQRSPKVLRPERKGHSEFEGEI